MDIHEATESMKCVIIKNENLDFIDQLLRFCPFKCFLKEGKKSTEIKDKNINQNLKSQVGICLLGYFCLQSWI